MIPVECMNPITNKNSTHTIRGINNGLLAIFLLNYMNNAAPKSIF